MSKCLPATLAIAAILFASTALATERSELEKSTVKAATDCVAAAALKDPNITTLYREDRLDEVTDRIVLHSSVCDNPLRAMRLLHDRLYGEGTGRNFLRGAYLADLPRAVRERIRGVFESRATAPLPPANQHRTMMNHNGSEMVLVEEKTGNGVRVAIYYRVPRDAMREIGVQEGTLLFEGVQIDDRYSGTAFTFNEDCPPIPYHVEGTIWSDHDSSGSGQYLTLRGLAPDEYRGCSAFRYGWNHNSKLDFEFYSGAKDKIGPYPAY